MVGVDWGALHHRMVMPFAYLYFLYIGLARPYYFVSLVLGFITFLSFTDVSLKLSFVVYNCKDWEIYLLHTSKNFPFQLWLKGKLWLWSSLLVCITTLTNSTCTGWGGLAEIDKFPLQPLPGALHFSSLFLYIHVWCFCQLVFSVW